MSLCGKFLVCGRADLCQQRHKKNIGRRYKEDPYTNAGEIVAREVAAVIWWPVLKGSWFLCMFLLSQQDTGGSMSIISASFCSLAFSVNTATRIHLFLCSVVYPYVNKLSLSVRVPVVSFADLLFSIYLKHFLSFIWTSGAIFLSFSAFASLSFISQWLNFIL